MEADTRNRSAQKMYFQYLYNTSVIIYYKQKLVLVMCSFFPQVAKGEVISTDSVFHISSYMTLIYFRNTQTLGPEQH